MVPPLKSLTRSDKFHGPSAGPFPAGKSPGMPNSWINIFIYHAPLIGNRNGYGVARGEKHRLRAWFPKSSFAFRSRDGLPPAPGLRCLQRACGGQLNGCTFSRFRDRLRPMGFLISGLPYCLFSSGVRPILREKRVRSWYHSVNGPYGAGCKPLQEFESGRSAAW